MNGLRLGVRVGLVGAALVLWVGCGSGKVEVGLFALCDEDHSCSDGMLCSQGQCVTQCGQGWQACEGQCVNLNADAQHCGGCGIACAEGTSCTKGTCDDRCVLPWLPCGDDCVDVAVDSTHCGGCDKPCADDELCEAGDCVARCAGEHGAMCQGACVDIWNDPRHCGGCGEVCEAGNLCVGGRCAEGCVAPRVACDGACVDVALDPDHCGDCETACNEDAICDAGDCVPRCAGEHGEWCEGTCVDTWNDNRNCGYCGVSCWTGSSCTEGRCDEYCAAPWILCGEACFNPAVDPDHCGDCDTQCEAGQICDAGDCVARCAGEHGLLCGGTCVDTWSSNRHCGGCDKACTDDQRCIEGKCAVVCVAPLSVCGDDCVDITNDPSHCGDCDESCKTDEVCEAGDCKPRCLGENDVLCTDVCADLDNNNQHCGACNHACDSGLTCIGGRCLPYCVPPLSLCDTSCQNLDEDPSHCGDCDTACGTNQVCSLGKCACLLGFYDVGGTGDCEQLPPCIVFASVNGTGDGSSWTAAEGDLQTAIDAAAALASARLDGQCSVFATAGTYRVYETSGADTLLLRPGVLVAGGFAGTESTLDEREVEPASGLPIGRSVLDGRSADGQGNVRHVVTGASAATLDGFAVTGGRVEADTEGEDGYGAGLVAVDATGLMVRRCVFEDHAAPNGAAISVKGGDLAIEYARFSRNAASKDGGAIMARGVAKLSITAGLFDRNTAPSGVGGAICSADTAALTITGTSFTLNGARWEGGALWHVGTGALALSNSQFWLNNTIPSPGGSALLGGALLVRGAELRDIDQGMAAAAGPMQSVQMAHVNLQGNVADCEGGAVYLKGISEAVLADVSLTVNKAGLGCEPGGGGLGGGIAAHEVGRLQMLDATFGRNTAFYSGGGGYFEKVGTLAVDRADFSGNVSTHGAGGAAFVKGDLSGQMTFGNVVIANNIADVVGGGLALVDLAGADMAMVRFEDNSALSGGALFAASVGRIALFDAEFERNRAINGSGYGAGGGAILAKDYGSMAIRRAAFTGNRNTGAASNGSAMLLCTRPGSEEGRRTLGEASWAMCGFLFADFGSGPVGASGLTTLEDVTFSGNTPGVVVRGEQLGSFALVRARVMDNVDPMIIGQFFLDGVLATSVLDSEFVHSAGPDGWAGDFYVRERCGAPGVSSITVRNTTFREQLLSGRSGGSAFVSEGINQVTLDRVWVDGYTSGGLAAGFWIKGANVLVTDSRFTNNVAYGASAMEIAPGEPYNCGSNLPNVVETVTIRDTLFENNKATTFAGAIRVQCAQSGSPGTAVVTLENTRFVNNGSKEGGSGLSVGGGAYVQQVKQLKVHNSQFIDNAAMSGAAGGLGLYLAESVEVSDSLFEENVSGYRGGGLFLEGGWNAWAESFSVVRTTFRNNHTGTVGGGLSAGNVKHLTVSDCRFYGNTAGSQDGDQHYASGGGAFVDNVTQVDLDRTAFLDSVVGTSDTQNYNGGAVAIQGVTTLNVRDSLFANNQIRALPDVVTCGAAGTGDCGRGRGGAILAKMKGETAGGPTSVLINGSTFVNNGTPRSEAAVGIMKYSHDANPTMVTAAVSVVNSIVWNNLPMGQGVVVTGEGYVRVPADQTPVVASHTDIDEALTGVSMFNTDPLFQTSGSAEFALYRLQSGSPLVGQGDPAVMSATDLLGESRLTPPAIGAIELVP